MRRLAPVVENAVPTCRTVRATTSGMYEFNGMLFKIKKLCDVVSNGERGSNYFEVDIKRPTFATVLV